MCFLSTFKFIFFNLWFTSLLNLYRKQRLYNGWQWASEYSILNPSMRCLNEASPFPAQSPLVLVSYLFHKQKKISKLGWAAIWQSVCLKLIFNTRTKNIRYVKTEKTAAVSAVSRILTQLYAGTALGCNSYWFTLSLLFHIHFLVHSINDPTLNTSWWGSNKRIVFYLLHLACFGHLYVWKCRA